MNAVPRRRRLRLLGHDTAGSPAVEFAMTAPALIMLVFGIIQLGMALTAYAGVRNAVEVGARYATVYPYPTTAQIYSKVRTNAFGVGALSDVANPTTSGTCKLYTGTTSGTGTYTVNICTGTANGATYVEVSMTYPITMSLGVTSLSAYDMTYTRRVYQQ